MSPEMMLINIIILLILVWVQDKKKIRNTIERRDKNKCNNLIQHIYYNLLLFSKCYTSYTFTTNSSGLEEKPVLASVIVIK